MTRAYQDPAPNDTELRKRPHMLGFVILSHRDPGQLLRLVTTLNRVYGDPPIVCHHDFNQSAIDRTIFPQNVRFVVDYAKTGWGKWSLVEAALLGLRDLYEDGGPEWFTLLSSADYPVMRAEDVYRQLESSGVDAMIDYRPVDATREEIEGTGNHPAHNQHSTAGSIYLAKNRYMKAILKVPLIRFGAPRSSSTVARGMRFGSQTISLPFRSPLSPFDTKFRCYVGSQWLTANTKVARLLLSPTPKHRKLRRYLRKRVVPDECFFQSVIVNQTDLKVQNDPKRFVEWLGGGAHPIALRMEDLPTILGSDAFFARKFDPDTSLLNQIDAMVSS